MPDTPRRWLLRERTSAEHAAVDIAVGAFHDLSSYVRYLRSTAAFRRSIEAAIAAAHWPSALAGWTPSSAADAVEQDLADLGTAVPANKVAAPAVHGDRLLGALYVLEGSGLGARVLYKRAQELGLSAEYGGRHLALLSSGVERWREFLQRLESADPFDIDAAVEGSLAAFGSARKAFGISA